MQIWKNNRIRFSPTYEFNSKFLYLFFIWPGHQPNTPRTDHISGRYRNSSSARDYYSDLISVHHCKSKLTLIDITYIFHTRYSFIKLLYTIEDKHFPNFYRFIDRSKIKRVEKSWAFHQKINSRIINTHLHFSYLPWIYHFIYIRQRKKVISVSVYKRFPKIEAKLRVPKSVELSITGSSCRLTFALLTGLSGQILNLF